MVTIVIAQWAHSRGDVRNAPNAFIIGELVIGCHFGANEFHVSTKGCEEASCVKLAVVFGENAFIWIAPDARARRRIYMEPTRY